jgi:16S rRNA (guanine527-N7)-methyltransferase
MSCQPEEPLRDALMAAASALGLQLADAQAARLLHYLALLGRWNATYNLTAVRDPAAMLTQHLADCLAVVNPLRHQGVGGRLLDVGSGGGLPGVVLALLMPELENVTCIDPVGKKAAFVRQAAGALALPQLHAVHGKVEDLRGAGFDLVTARAFASLDDFTRLSRRALAPGACWMAMKGRVPQQEIDALPASVEVFHVEPLHVPGLDAARCLVWMRPAPAS